MNIFLNDQNRDLMLVADSFANKYQNATPFPNIHFENFFNPEILKKLLIEFPDLLEKSGIQYKDQLQKKSASKDDQSFGEETKQLMCFLNSAYFLQFLQRLTGIKEKLIGDPYFIGGGQHEIKKGGLLKIHADFNKHPTLNLDRRINVLIYLNEDWQESYGGHFELWDKEMESCKKRISPRFNTMAIFSTTDFSFHGHPNPLNCPETRSRKSLALYYYSNGRPAEEVIQGQESHSTLFKKRKNNLDDEDIFNNESRLTNITVKSIIKNLTPPIVLKTLKYLFKNH